MLIGPYPSQHDAVVNLIKQFMIIINDYAIVLTKKSSCYDSRS